MNKNKGEIDLDRMHEFVKYYRALNEYVIFYELLYSKNEIEHYKDFLKIHEQLMVDKESCTDEQFVAELNVLMLDLRKKYATLLGIYFNDSLKNFNIFKNNNKEARASYNDIVCHIRDEPRMDNYFLTECVQKIEQAISLFSACLKI